MARIISGRLLNMAPTQESQEGSQLASTSVTASQPESLGESVLRNLTAAGTKVVSSPFHAADALLNLKSYLQPDFAQAIREGVPQEMRSQLAPNVFEKPKLESSNIGGAVERGIIGALGKSPEYLEPRTKFEKGFQWVAQELPFLPYTMGTGAFLKKLGLSALGDVAAKGVESLGGGPLLQAAARGGTQLVAGKLRPSQITKPLNELNRERYNKLFQEGEKLHGDVSDIKSTLQKQYDLSQGLSTESKKYLAPQLEKLSKEMPGATQSVDKLLKLEQDISEALSDFNTPRRAVPILKELETKVQDAIKNSVPKSFFEEYKSAKSLHKDLAKVRQAGEYIKDTIKPEQLINKALPSLLVQLFTGDYKSALVTLGVLSAKEIGALAPSVPAFASLVKSKDGRKLVSDITLAAFKENPKALINGIRKLDVRLSKEQESLKSKMIPKLPKGIKMVSGKLY